MSLVAKNFMISNRIESLSFCEISCAYDFKQSEAMSVLASVSHLYPNFDAWLTFRFIRGLGCGERKAIIAHDGNNLLGVSLLKLTEEEKKICTLFVNEKARRTCSDMKVGTNLMKRSLDLLNSGEISITVCSERHEELMPLLHNFSFEKTHEINKLYRDDSSEFFYRLNL